MNTSPYQQAAGRVTAEQITLYPPGVPALIPGGGITAGIIDYLHTALEASMVCRTGPTRN